MFSVSCYTKIVAMFQKVKNPLILFLVILVSWGLYRYLFRFPEWVDEFIAKPIIMLLPILFVVTVLESKLLGSIGLSRKKFLKNVIVGIAVGVFIAGEMTVTNRFKYGSITLNSGNLSGSPLFLAGVVTLATGLIEEVVFRGYFLNRLWEVFQSEFFANLLSTVLFVVIHVPRIFFVPDGVSYDPFTFFVSLVQLFFLGALNGIVFVRTKTVVAPTISHAIWNFSAVMIT